MLVSPGTLAVVEVYVWLTCFQFSSVPPIGPNRARALTIRHLPGRYYLPNSRRELIVWLIVPTMSPSALIVDNELLQTNEGGVLIDYEAHCFINKCVRHDAIFGVCSRCFLHISTRSRRATASPKLRTRWRRPASCGAATSASQSLSALEHFCKT